MKKALYLICMGALLLFMLLAPQDAVAGAQYGLLLWFHTIIPTLLPFMILSNLVIRLDAMSWFTGFLSPALKKFPGIGAGGTYTMIAGFLFGYPMGAKLSADLYRAGSIPGNEARYLLSFCNNVSPMFTVSYIVQETLGQPALTFPTLVILYGSALLCGLLFWPFYMRPARQPAAPPRTGRSKSQAKNPSEGSGERYLPSPRTGALPKPAMRPGGQGFSFYFQILDESIMNGFEAVTKLGGYMILFAIASQMISYCCQGVATLEPFLTGICEITNGISKIDAAPLPSPVKYTGLVAVTAFGGFSCIAQTASMIRGTALPIREYIMAKLIQTAIACGMAIVYVSCCSPFS